MQRDAKTFVIFSKDGLRRRFAFYKACWETRFTNVYNIYTDTSIINVRAYSTNIYNHIQYDMSHTSSNRTKTILPVAVGLGLGKVCRRIQRCHHGSSAEQLGLREAGCNWTRT